MLICLDTREAQHEAGDDDELSFGSWRYHGINLEDEAWEAWEDVPLLILSAANILLNNRKHEACYALHERFRVMVAYGLLGVADSEAVARLKKSRRFAC